MMRSVAIIKKICTTIANPMKSLPVYTSMNVLSNSRIINSLRSISSSGYRPQLSRLPIIPFAIYRSSVLYPLTEAILEQGFNAQGNNSSIIDHIKYDLSKAKSCYIATSTSPDVARRFISLHYSSNFTICSLPPLFVNISSKIKWYNEIKVIVYDEKEMSGVNHIPAECVAGVQPYSGIAATGSTLYNSQRFDPSIACEILSCDESEAKVIENIERSSGRLAPNERYLTAKETVIVNSELKKGLIKPAAGEESLDCFLKGNYPLIVINTVPNKSLEEVIAFKRTQHKERYRKEMYNLLFFNNSFQNYTGQEASTVSQTPLR